MPKRYTNRLGLPQITTDSDLTPDSLGFGSATALVERNREWIAQHRDRQLVTMFTVFREEEYAISLVQEINSHAATTFCEIAHFSDQIDQQVRGTPYEQDVVEFNRHLRQLSANHIEGYVRVGARVIGQILVEPIPSLPEERKRKNWLQRLLTGDEYRTS